MIYEVVIVTVDSKNKPHVAPMGISIKNKDIILKPFKPSQTLENILNTKESDRFLKIVQNLKKLKSGQLDKINIEVKKNKLKKNLKKGIF